MVGAWQPRTLDGELEGLCWPGGTLCLLANRLVAGVGIQPAPQWAGVRPDLEGLQMTSQGPPPACTPPAQPPGRTGFAVSDG